MKILLINYIIVAIVYTALVIKNGYIQDAYETYFDKGWSIKIKLIAYLLTILFWISIPILWPIWIIVDFIYRAKRG